MAQCAIYCDLGLIVHYTCTVETGWVGLYNCTGETGLVNLHNMCSGNAAMAVQKACPAENGKKKISLDRLELIDAIFQV